MEKKIFKQTKKQKKEIDKNDVLLKTVAWTLLIITVLSTAVLAIFSGIATYNEIIDSGVPGGIPPIELSLSLFIATLISLGIVFALVTYFLWKPMNEHLEIRKSNIETNIDAASYKNKEAAKNLSNSVLTEKKARIIAKEIVDFSKQEGNEQKKEIVTAAKNQTDKMLEQTRDQILKEKDQMQEEIKKQILETSLLAAEKIIERNMDSDVNKQMIKELLLELE